MKPINKLVVSLLIASLSLLLPMLALAADGAGGQAAPGPKDKLVVPATSDTKPEVPESLANLPTYKPPLRGAPGGRLAGGTRGGADGSLSVSALVPDHIGLTVQEQPDLYWFLSESTKHPVELTLIEDQALRPIVEARVKQALQPGVQYIRLADYGVRLKTGVPYKWFVAIVPDPDQRSKDIIAGGEIERVELQGGLRSKLDQAGKSKAPLIYAEAGLWYDALAAASDLVATAPQDALLRKQRASLLQQVGLSEVADYLMKH